MLLFVLVALTLATAAKFFFFRLIPSVDLPNHLAVATIIRYASDSSHYFNLFFQVDSFLMPTSFHAWFCSLPLFPSVELANRIFLSGYAILLPLSVWLVLRSVKANLWFTVLSIPLIQNYSLSWGFLGYTIAIPTVLILLVTTSKYHGTMRIQWALASSALLVLLYFMHVQVLLFALLFVFACGIYRHRTSLVRLGSDILILLPASGLTMWWWFTKAARGGGTDSVFLSHYYSGEYWASFLHRFLSLISFDNYFLFPREKGILVGALLGGAILLIALIFMLHAPKRLFQQIRSPNGFYVSCFCLLALLCFLILPSRLPGQDYLYQRFSVLVLLGFVLLGGIAARDRLHYSLKTLLTIIVVVSGVLWHDYYAEFNRNNESFRTDVFPVEAPHVATSALIFSYFYRGQHMYLQFPNYHIIWNQGVISTAITDYRFSLVRRKRGSDNLPRFNQRAGVDPGGFRPSDIRSPYVVTRGTVHPVIRPSFRSLKVVRKTGEWTLWRNLEMP